METGQAVPKQRSMMPSKMLMILLYRFGAWLFNHGIFHRCVYIFYNVRMQKSTWSRGWKEAIFLACGILLCALYGSGLPGASFPGMGTITNEIHKEAQSLASTLSLEEKCASVLLVAYGGAKQFVPEFASGYQRIPVGG